MAVCIILPSSWDCASSWTLGRCFPSFAVHEETIRRSVAFNSVITWTKPLYTAGEGWTFPGKHRLDSNPRPGIWWLSALTTHPWCICLIPSARPLAPCLWIVPSCSMGAQYLRRGWVVRAFTHDVGNLGLFPLLIGWWCWLQYSWPLLSAPSSFLSFCLTGN